MRIEEPPGVVGVRKTASLRTQDDKPCRAAALAVRGGFNAACHSHGVHHGRFVARCQHLFYSSVRRIPLGHNKTMTADGGWVGVRAESHAKLHVRTTPPITVAGLEVLREETLSIALVKLYSFICYIFFPLTVIVDG